MSAVFFHKYLINRLIVLCKKVGEWRTRYVSKITNLFSKITNSPYFIGKLTVKKEILLV